MTHSQHHANRRTASRLLLVTCLMFGFGYALVPLYNVFCDITGLNGKTGRLSDFRDSKTWLRTSITEKTIRDPSRDTATVLE